MKLKSLLSDLRGTVLIEYAVTLPLFIVLLFGFIQVGLLTWTQVGLQHAVEMAARCANTVCGNNATNISNYAVTQSYTVNTTASNFHVTPNTTCGTNGGTLVTANYTFNLINYIFTWTLNARSCYPN